MGAKNTRLRKNKGRKQKSEVGGRRTEVGDRRSEGRGWDIGDAPKLLMTGTGIVPSNDFTLQSKDEIRITIEPIGTLVNTGK